MKINANLKAYAVAQQWATADATDDAIKSAVLEKLASGDLPADKFGELTKAAPAPGEGVMQTLVAGQTKLTELVAKLAERQTAGNDGANAFEAAVDKAAAQLVARMEKAKEPVAEVKAPVVEKPAAHGGMEKFLSENPPSAANVRVCEAIESYSSTRKAAMFPMRKANGDSHPFAGERATWEGNAIDEPSDRDKAVAGAWFKYMVCSNSPQEAKNRGWRLSDHDRQIVEYAKHNCRFHGLLNGRVSSKSSNWGGDGIEVHREKLSDMQKVALLDDSTSGGLEVVPIEFDDMFILTPLLHSELASRVEMMTVSRRRIEGASFGNPTFAAQTEGSAVTAFDATAFISEMNTTIFPAAGAMEIGLDFLEDSPIAVANVLVNSYGEAHKTWLDTQIAVGDGTTEPQGVFNASGMTAVNTENGTSGPIVVGDLEALMFGVQKRFRNTKGGKNAFLGNDTTYSRIRGIPIGEADARRVFGMDHFNYKAFGHDVAINNDDVLTNNLFGFFNFGYYRLYRRLPISVRMERAGNYLTLRNEMLLYVRVRYGGRLTLGGAGAVSQDFPN